MHAPANLSGGRVHIGFRAVVVLAWSLGSESCRHFTTMSMASLHPNSCGLRLPVAPLETITFSPLLFASSCKGQGHKAILQSFDALGKLSADWISVCALAVQCSDANSFFHILMPHFSQRLYKAVGIWISIFFKKRLRKLDVAMQVHIFMI